MVLVEIDTLKKHVAYMHTKVLRIQWLPVYVAISECQY